MENLNLTLIPQNSLESVLSEIREMKNLLITKKEEDYQKQWVTKKEAGKRLGVCQKTLDHYFHKGVLPYSRFAGKIYIKASDIDAHLEKNYIKN